MTYEDKILAYLDGSLSEEESAELLHSLSVSPEKRAVLDEHLRLKNMVALGQKPFAIPASTERTLAERIPALASSSVPERLARRSAFATFFAGTAEWGSSLLRAPIVRWGLGFASLAAVGVTAWMLTISTMPQESASYHDGSSQNPLVQNAPSAASSSRATAAGNSAAALGQSSSGRSALTESESVHRATNSLTTIDKTIGEADAVTLNRDAKPAASHGLSDTRTLATDASAKPVTSVSPNSTNSTPPIDPLEPKPELASIAPATAVAIPHSIALQQLGEAGWDGALSLSVGYGQYSYQLQGVNGSVTGSASLPELALSYSLSPSLAIQIEGGTAVHPAIGVAARNERITSITGQTYTRVVYSTNVESAQSPFAKLGLEFAINPEDGYVIHVGGDGGVAFASSLLPVAAARIGLVHPLNSLVAIDIAGVLAGSWGQTSASSNLPRIDAASSGPVGVVHQEVSVARAFTTSLGLRAAIRYSF